MTLHLHSCEPGQPETVSVSGWRTIATAPIGRDVLTFNILGEITVQPADGEWWRLNAKLLAVPTHWMPLPDPPVTP